MNTYKELSGQYVMGQTLGTGGFGKVKLATHLATGEKVAIKIMNKKRLHDDMERVYKEIQALQNLSHSHICQLYQVIESEAYVFLVMEYCCGGELFDYIIQKERLEEEEAKGFFRQIVAGVAYCHRLGFSHRDLKPENILLDSDQNLKIVDFGLCVRPNKGTQLLTSCGSPNYAAPELLLGQKYFGPQVDIWSLGVLLYALLCGDLPFEDETSDKLYAKILKGHYDEPEWLSDESKQIIRSLLTVDPQRRMSTEELCAHPWLNTGFEVSVRDLSAGSEGMRKDADCLRVLSAYLGLPSQEVWQRLANDKKYDYIMATYLLLLDRKKKKLPLRKLRSPLCDMTPRKVNEVTSPEVAVSSTYVITKGNAESKKKNCTPCINENIFCTPDEPRETPIRRSGVVGGRRASKRIRSPGLGDRDPIPKKLVAGISRTPVTSEQEKQGTKTPSSARRVLNGIRQVLTPRRRSIPRPVGQPAVLRTKNMINVTSTCSRNPGQVLTNLKTALEEKGIQCISNGPPARAALLAARAVGVDLQTKVIDLFKKEQLSNQDFLKVNPQHTIPTLDDNGFILWESRAIAGYFVRQYAKDDSLYPKNPQLKAVVDQRLYFDATTLWPRIRAISFAALFLGERTVSEEKKKMVDEALAWLEKFLHGRKWLVGDKYTIADICVYATISSLAAMGWDLSRFPNVTSWLNEARKLPGADENEAGAKLFGDAVKSKLDPGQIP